MSGTAVLYVPLTEDEIKRLARLAEMDTPTGVRSDDRVRDSLADKLWSALEDQATIIQVP